MNVADKIREKIKNSQNKELESFKKELIEMLEKRFKCATDVLIINTLSTKLRKNFEPSILDNPSSNIIALISEKDITHIVAFLRDHGFIADCYKYVGFDNRIIKVKLY